MEVGDIVYYSYGVGERIIKPVKITKIKGKIATVKPKFGDEFEISIGCLSYDRDIIQEIFDFVKFSNEERW